MNMHDRDADEMTLKRNTWQYHSRHLKYSFNSICNRVALYNATRLQMLYNATRRVSLTHSDSY